MKDGFDFNRVGKREPYTVPDDFFRQLEDNIISATVPARRPVPLWRTMLRWSAAACAIAAIVVCTSIPSTCRSYDMEDVESTFARLSDADQDCLLEAYQEDLFINP